MDHLAKTHERVFERRQRMVVEPILGKEQYGYRKNRSTTDLLFALRITLEKVWEFK